MMLKIDSSIRSETFVCVCVFCCCGNAGVCVSLLLNKSGAGSENVGRNSDNRKPFYPPSLKALSAIGTLISSFATFYPFACKTPAPQCRGQGAQNTVSHNWAVVQLAILNVTAAIPAVDLQLSRGYPCVIFRLKKLDHPELLVCGQGREDRVQSSRQ